MPVPQATQEAPLGVSGVEQLMHWVASPEQVRQLGISEPQDTQEVGSVVLIPMVLPVVLHEVQIGLLLASLPQAPQLGSMALQGRQ